MFGAFDDTGPRDEHERVTATNRERPKLNGIHGLILRAGQTASAASYDDVPAAVATGESVPVL